ncbi:MAG: hypothetical protein ACXWTS_05910 [Methylococcaceae bacterium]
MVTIVLSGISIVGRVSDSVTRQHRSGNYRVTLSLPTVGALGGPTYIRCIQLIMKVKNFNLMAVTLRRGNSSSSAPALRDARASPAAFPRRSVGTMQNWLVSKP